MKMLKIKKFHIDGFYKKISIKSFFKNRVTRNACWLIGGNIVYKLIAFIVGIWTARFLGPSNYGLINYALAYTTFFFSLSSLGINSVIVKEFVDHPNEEGETMGTTLVLQGIASLLSVVVICLIVFIVDYGETITLIVTLLCSLGLFFQMMDSLKYWFQSKLESKNCAIATTVAYIITSVYKIILLAMGANVSWFAVATSVDYFCVAIILFILYRKKGGPTLRFSKIKAKSLLKSSYHYILSGLMVSIYGATDRLMLKQMVGENSVGYYGTAISICNVWVFVLSAIIDSLNPVIMELNKIDIEKYKRKNRQLYAIVFYCSVFAGVIFTVFGEFGIKLLYGAEFLPAVNPLRIITWYTAFSYLGVARNAWIVCEGNQKYLTPLYAGAALLNVVLNFVLIPVLETSGAALASLLTQVSTVFIFPLMIKELRPNVMLMIDSILLKKIKKK